MSPHWKRQEIQNISNIFQPKITPKTTKNNRESDAQEIKKTIVAKSEKSNLCPNTNPNYSDSFRY